MARFTPGDGRVGEVRYTADIKIGIAGRRGALTAFAPEADFPALLRRGAREALGGLLDFAGDVWAIWNHGVDIPLKVNEMGHYALSVVAFGHGSSRVDLGPQLAASYFAWTPVDKRPDLSNGGSHLPTTEDELFRFEPPRVSAASTGATLGDPRVNSAPDSAIIIMKLHVNWGHASAHRLQRVSADSESGNSNLVNYAGEVLEHCEICRAFDKAPDVTIAATSAVSMFNEKRQVDPFFF